MPATLLTIRSMGRTLTAVAGSYRNCRSLHIVQLGFEEAGLTITCPKSILPRLGLAEF